MSGKQDQQVERMRAELDSLRTEILQLRAMSTAADRRAEVWEQGLNEEALAELRRACPNLYDRFVRVRDNLRRVIGR